jgi:predicted nuclease of restriction endonuclease-like (RecB) superfamily
MVNYQNWFLGFGGNNFGKQKNSVGVMSKIESIISQKSDLLYKGIDTLIEQARSKVAIYVNKESTLLYWSIGRYINTELRKEERLQYGAKILATLSQLLTLKYGKGFSYSALTRMSKVAAIFEKEIVATLSQQLSWSHLIELANIDNVAKRLFYCRMSSNNRWGVRELREKIDSLTFERTAIALKDEKEIMEVLSIASNETIPPEMVFKNTYVLDFLNLPYFYSEKELENAIILQLEQFILELGNGFAFLERQKRISIDAIDYHLDMLFYHRKLNRLVAIDLKLGKFKPEYKAQMELYLRYLQKHEKQAHENDPIGLLLCSEGNTEHIELLMLGEENIKVAQYLTQLPGKQWFIDKLHRAIEISKMNLNSDQ